VEHVAGHDSIGSDEAGHDFDPAFPNFLLRRQIQISDIQPRFKLSRLSVTEALAGMADESTGRFNACTRSATGSADAADLLY
jgi:hypothetical protein